MFDSMNSHECKKIYIQNPETIHIEPTVRYHWNTSRNPGGNSIPWPRGVAVPRPRTHRPILRWWGDPEGQEGPAVQGLGSGNNGTNSGIPPIPPVENSTKLEEHEKKLGVWKTQAVAVANLYPYQWVGVGPVGDFNLVGGLVSMNFMTFHSVGNVIIPTDEVHHFSRWLKPPSSNGFCCSWNPPKRGESSQLVAGPNDLTHSRDCLLLAWWKLNLCLDFVVPEEMGSSSKKLGIFGVLSQYQSTMWMPRKKKTRKKWRKRRANNRTKLIGVWAIAHILKGRSAYISLYNPIYLYRIL